MSKKEELRRWHRNKTVRASIKTASGETTEAISRGDAEKARAALLNATRQLDKAASKGVIHKNAVGRKKAKLTRKLNLLTKSNNK